MYFWAKSTTSQVSLEHQLDSTIQAKRNYSLETTLDHAALGDIARLVDGDPGLSLLEVTRAESSGDVDGGGDGADGSGESDDGKHFGEVRDAGVVGRSEVAVESWRNKLM